MPEYRVPLRDMRFVLEEIADLSGVAKLEGFEGADPQDVEHMLEEAARFFEDVWVPTNQVGDTEGCRLEGDVVVTPDCFKPAYAKLAEAGWAGLSLEAEYGGHGMPALVSAAVQEMFSAANASLSMLPGLTIGAAELLEAHADEEQKGKYLPKMISGEWSGTMNLTEPDAGSDVGALKTRAVKQDDGSYRVKGTKIFISFGEQDITSNIIHLVLARTPDAPPGTKGISCFIVPKFLVNADGSLGDRNDVKCVSIEHKLGIKASPTCVLAFGDETDGAIGYLIGEENRGMKYMFTMMNSARLAVGLAAPAISERAFQAARQYAQERVQGRPLGAAADEHAPIIVHPDVRRMLVTMKAYVEAQRMICYVNAAALDRAAHSPSAEEREAQQHFADLLTPITKAWCTDVALEVASLGIQVHGGMGFVEETGVAQFYRDLRIQPIYEGTNGIQALDLIGRKLPLGGGQPVMALLNTMKAFDADLAEAGDELAPLRAGLAEGVAVLEKATLWVFENGLKDPIDAASGATPYLRLFGYVFATYSWARAALRARTLRASGSNWGTDFLDAKIATGNFFASQLLPLGLANLAAATAGKDALFAISPAAL